MNTSRTERKREMYFNILKRDLKRKKTMNVILLLFTMLASMFVSSGINNVVTVMNGTNYYLDKAGVGDFVVITQNGDGGVEDIIEDSSNVTSYKMEDAYWGSIDNIKVDDEQLDLKSNTIVFQELSDNGITLYQTDNEELTEVKPGEVYVTAGVLKRNELEVGDELELDYYGVENTFTIAGEIKDALLGSDMMGNTRFIFSHEDYEEFEKEELKPMSGCMYNIKSDHIAELQGEIAKGENILFSGSRSMIKMSYVMEMIVAMIVLVLSACLCIVSFVLLKFVITFTINEEFREIGVMKAIGIHNFKIRSIYLTKYFVMSVVGGVIGLFMGIPFGNMLIASVSEKMVLSNDYGIYLNVVGALIVVFVMTGFAYLCTGKVKKSTPVDAIRNGATGERYGKKGKYSLKKTHFSNAFYMAVNDVVSAPRRFMTIIFSFFICSVFVFGLVEVTDTMLSDRLITTFGKKSDAYITSSKLLRMDMISEEGNEDVKTMLSDVEEDLKELGMPGKTNFEVWYKYNVTFDGRTTSICCQQNKYTDTTDYDYIEGSAPQNDKEIAITKQIAEDIGARIGDTVTIDFGSEKKECMVVAYFQTMNQLGSVIRLHQDAPTNMIYANAMMSIQIEFDDEPNAKVIDDRIEELRDFYDTEDVYNAAGFCNDCMKVAGTMQSVQYLLLAITCIVVILVTILMERSFISDETSQIALLKAIGFKDRFIIRWQVYRFLLVAVITEILAVIFTYPITKLWCDPIWSMMGASDVKYYFNPLSLCLVYPGIILLINLITVWLTAGVTKKITCNDVGNVE